MNDENEVTMVKKYKGIDVVYQVNITLTGFTHKGFSPNASVDHMKKQLKTRQHELETELARNKLAQEFLSHFKS